MKKYLWNATLLLLLGAAGLWWMSHRACPVPAAREVARPKAKTDNRLSFRMKPPLQVPQHHAPFVFQHLPDENEHIKTRPENEDAAVPAPGGTTVVRAHNLNTPPLRMPYADEEPAPQPSIDRPARWFEPQMPEVDDPEFGVELFPQPLPPPPTPPTLPNTPSEPENEEVPELSLGQIWRNLVNRFLEETGNTAQPEVPAGDEPKIILPQVDRLNDDAWDQALRDVVPLPAAPSAPNRLMLDPPVGQQSPGGQQPWWNILAHRAKLTPDEESLQKFWQDYYNAMKRYYGSLDEKIDQAAEAPNRIKFAPVIVNPQINWMVPNSPPFGPPPGPGNGPPAGNPPPRDDSSSSVPGKLPEILHNSLDAPDDEPVQPPAMESSNPAPFWQQLTLSIRAICGEIMTSRERQRPECTNLIKLCSGSMGNGFSVGNDFTRLRGVSIRGFGASNPGADAVFPGWFVAETASTAQTQQKTATDNAQPAKAQAIALKRRPAKYIAALLTKFCADCSYEGVRIAFDEDTNTLFIQQRDGDVNENRAFIEKMDSLGESGDELQLIRLKSALSDDLVPLVRAAIPDELRLLKLGIAIQRCGDGIRFISPDDTLRDAIQIVSLPTLNVLLISAPEKGTGLVAEIVRMLDVPPGTKSQVKVRTLQKSDATWVADIVLYLANSHASGRGHKILQISVTADASSNSLVVGGSSGALKFAENLITELDCDDSNKPSNVSEPSTSAPFWQDLIRNLFSFWGQERQRPEHAAAREGESLAHDRERIRAYTKGITVTRVNNFRLVDSQEDTADANPAIARKGTVLILRNQRVLEGDIQRKGEKYIVRRDRSEIVIQAKDVLQLCSDWDAAYQYMRLRMDLNGPKGYLELAKWCSVNDKNRLALLNARVANCCWPHDEEARKCCEIYWKRVEETESQPEPVATPSEPQADDSATPGSWWQIMADTIRRMFTGGWPCVRIPASRADELKKLDEPLPAIRWDEMLSTPPDAGAKDADPLQRFWHSFRQAARQARFDGYKTALTGAPQYECIFDQRGRRGMKEEAVQKQIMVAWLQAMYDRQIDRQQQTWAETTAQSGELCEGEKSFWNSYCAAVRQIVLNKHANAVMAEMEQSAFERKRKAADLRKLVKEWTAALNRRDKKVESGERFSYGMDRGVGIKNSNGLTDTQCEQGLRIVIECHRRLQDLDIEYPSAVGKALENAIMAHSKEADEEMAIWLNLYRSCRDLCGMVQEMAPAITAFVGQNMQAPPEEFQFDLPVPESICQLAGAEENNIVEDADSLQRFWIDYNLTVKRAYRIRCVYDFPDNESWQKKEKLLHKQIAAWKEALQSKYEARLPEADVWRDFSQAVIRSVLEKYENRLRDDMAKVCEPYKSKEEKLRMYIDEWTAALNKPNPTRRPLSPEQREQGKQIITECHRELLDLDLRFMKEIFIGPIVCDDWIGADANAGPARGQLGVRMQILSEEIDAEMQGIHAIFTPKGLDNKAQGCVLATLGKAAKTDFPTPKGFHNKAQGCVLATLGIAATTDSQPQRGCTSQRCTTPSGLRWTIDAVTQGCEYATLGYVVQPLRGKYPSWWSVIKLVLGTLRIDQWSPDPSARMKQLLLTSEQIRESNADLIRVINWETPAPAQEKQGSLLEAVGDFVRQLLQPDNEAEATEKAIEQMKEAEKLQDISSEIDPPATSPAVEGIPVRYLPEELLTRLYVTASDADEPPAKEEAQVAELIKKAAELQRKRKWEEAKVLYQQAHEILPDALAPLIGLAQVDSGIRQAQWKEQHEKVERAFDNNAARLREPITLDLNESLGDAIGKLRRQTGLNFVLDLPAMRAGGISKDTPVELEVHDVSLQSALKLLLGQVQLTYELRDEVVFISTERGLQGKLEPRAYNVKDLLAGRAGSQVKAAEIESLITNLVSQKTWSSNGGTGNIRFLPQTGTLVVNQTQAVHADVGELLNNLRISQIWPIAEKVIDSAEGIADLVDRSAELWNGHGENRPATFEKIPTPPGAVRQAGFVDSAAPPVTEKKPAPSEEDEEDWPDPQPESRESETDSPWRACLKGLIEWLMSSDEAPDQTIRATTSPISGPWTYGSGPLTPEEERLQRFWNDYYDSMKRYYGTLDRIDWVAYYKNHGYQINTGSGIMDNRPAETGGCGPVRTLAKAGTPAPECTLEVGVPPLGGRPAPVYGQWVAQPFAPGGTAQQNVIYPSGGNNGGYVTPEYCQGCYGRSRNTQGQSAGAPLVVYNSVPNAFPAEEPLANEPSSCLDMFADLLGEIWPVFGEFIDRGWPSEPAANEVPSWRPKMNPEEARLDNFWRGYYDALSGYYKSLSRVDWVAYYKNHGQQINYQGPNGINRIQFAPVFVNVGMSWLPNGSASNPAASYPAPGANNGWSIAAGPGTPPGFAPAGYVPVTTRSVVPQCGATLCVAAPGGSGLRYMPDGMRGAGAAFVQERAQRLQEAYQRYEAAGMERAQHLQNIQKLCNAMQAGQHVDPEAMKDASGQLARVMRKQAEAIAEYNTILAELGPLSEPGPRQMAIPCCDPAKEYMYPSELAPEPMQSNETARLQTLCAELMQWAAVIVQTPLPVPAWWPYDFEENQKHPSDVCKLLMPPIPPGHKTTCEDPPDIPTINRAMPVIARGIPGICEVFRDDMDYCIEKLVDHVDPPRFFPLIGLAQMHHCHWKISVFYTETTELHVPWHIRSVKRRVEVLYLDQDHLHPCVSENEAEKTEKAPNETPAEPKEVEPAQQPETVPPDASAMPQGHHYHHPGCPYLNGQYCQPRYDPPAPEPMPDVQPVEPPGGAS